MIFGGSTGLKAMWQTILKNLSKSKGKKISKFFPKMSAEEKTLTKLGEKLDPTAFKAFNTREKDLKLEGIEHLISRLKQDKEMIEQVAANKAMKDEGLDFLMKHFEKSEMYPKYLNKYTDIDKDILQMETIKKNLIMKDRKLNASGGRVPLFGGGAAKKLWQKFIEKQFLKASNDIRQGKGLFKGLTQEQWIKQHDNLTKKLKEWEMGGKKSLPKDMKEYFGMNEIQLVNAFKKAQTQVKKPYRESKLAETVSQEHPSRKGEWEVEMGERETDWDYLIKKKIKAQKELDILQKFKPEGKPHATGGRVSLSAGGLAGMLGE